MAPKPAMHPRSSAPDGLAHVRAAVEHARHVLPAQGPIGVFVHHNTLHAFQSRPFHEAIAEACALHGAEGYLAEERFRQELARGRIDEVDLAHALDLRDAERPNHRLGAFEVRDVERLMLLEPIEVVPSAIRFAIQEGGELDAPADRALLEAARRIVVAAGPSTVERADLERTHRDLLLRVGAPDPSLVPNAFLQRFLAGFLDQGVSRWPMPGRERGLLACASELFAAAAALGHPIVRRAGRALAAMRDRGASPEAMVLAVLEDLGEGVPMSAPHHAAGDPHGDPDGAHADGPLDRAVLAHLLQLPGFAGMVARLEANPGDRDADAPPVSLLELLVLRLVLDREAIVESAHAVGVRGPVRSLRAQLERLAHERAGGDDGDDELVRTARLFAVSRALGLRSHGLAMFDRPKTEDDAAGHLLAAIDAFDEVTRRRVFHEAYEHHHLREITAALASNAEAPASPESSRARFQMAFCIDDREEGIRRYVEAFGPDHVTYGVAGFFGVAMQFTSLDNPFASALCPVVVTPAHTVRESIAPAHAHLEPRRKMRRALWARARYETLDASRSLTRGAVFTAALGIFSIVPLILRVAFPRWSDRAGRRLGAWLLPALDTQLDISRAESEPSEQEPRADDEAAPALPAGFTRDERVQRVKGTLENIGLTRDFAPLVAFFGHGASSVNNPHQSAYDCGACGGRSGGPNARAFAAMANDPVVRTGLRAVGIDIPDTTWFLGGLHDTTTDGITIFDTDALPESLRGELAALRTVMETARRQSAQERCRRFEHARPGLSAEAALRHVEERAVDLSQARPEYNHATNAACIVGRRALTRGLFLDRRSFLVSYDPTIDADGAILARILGAVVPVGAGINLEYLFSTVDPEVWGAGSKLPHNLASLLGVMEGASGDLRTGLPKQMTEIHEPVRLLCIVEASVETILGVAAKNAEVRELVTKGWVRVVSVHPESGEMRVFESGAFVPYEPEARELPEVARWQDWYTGKLDHLTPARIAANESHAEAAE